MYVCMVNILHPHLCMRKLCASWVPWLLKIDQKRIRVTSSEQNLAYFNRNPKEFLRRFVTMNGSGSTTILRNHVKRQYSGLDFVKVHYSARKGNNSLGVTFIEYLGKRKTITGAYYAALLNRLVDEVRKKQPHLKMEKVLFHYGNGPSHPSKIA